MGQDGLVAYERIKGKKPTVLGLEFGEKLAYMKAKGDKLNKLNQNGEWDFLLGSGGGRMKLWWRLLGR